MNIKEKMINGLVAVIIPVYNRAQLLREAVQSVLAQTYRPIEIIIVDDGSTDSTPVTIGQLVAEYPGTIRVVHKKHSGPGLAREAGRIVSRGEFIQYLDSDDWLLPRKFEFQVRALRERPECDIAYCISRLVDFDGNTIVEPAKLTGSKFEYLFPALLVNRWWYTHTPLFRKSISDRAGAWANHRPEDWELEGRMGALRAKLVYCDVVLSCQRSNPDPNCVSRGPFRKYLLDEAWFLPRLYQYALKAGVGYDMPEMQFFSKWVFMRARDMGAIGESGKAWELLRLAKKSSLKVGFKIRSVELAVHFFGWKAISRVYGIAHKLLINNKKYIRYNSSE